MAGLLPSDHEAQGQPRQHFGPSPAAGDRVRPEHRPILATGPGNTRPLSRGLWTGRQHPKIDPRKHSKAEQPGGSCAERAACKKCRAGARFSMIAASVHAENFLRLMTALGVIARAESATKNHRRIRARDRFSPRKIFPLHHASTRRDIASAVPEILRACSSPHGRA